MFAKKQETQKRRDQCQREKGAAKRRWKEEEEVRISFSSSSGRKSPFPLQSQRTLFFLLLFFFSLRSLNPRRGNPTPGYVSTLVCECGTSRPLSGRRGWWWSFLLEEEEEGPFQKLMPERRELKRNSKEKKKKIGPPPFLQILCSLPPSLPS